MNLLKKYLIVYKKKFTKFQRDTCKNGYRIGMVNKGNIFFWFRLHQYHYSRNKCDSKPEVYWLIQIFLLFGMIGQGTPVL